MRAGSPSASPALLSARTTPERTACTGAVDELRQALAAEPDHIDARQALVGEGCEDSLCCLLKAVTVFGEGLGQVAGELPVADHPVGQVVEAALVALDEDGEARRHPTEDAEGRGLGRLAQSEQPGEPASSRRPGSLERR